MDQGDIDELGGDYLSVPRKPIKRPRTEPETVIVGFDTEFVPETELDGVVEPLKVLSVQFSVMVGGEVRSVVFETVEKKLTVEWVTNHLALFLRDSDRIPAAVKCGRQSARRVLLVAHYAAAELSTFEDALRDLAIRQMSGKAHHARLPPMVNDEDDAVWHIRIVDLFAYFKTGLAEIGRMVGLPKLDEEPTTLDWLKQVYPERFKAYAERDAEIAVTAYERFRSELLGRWGIDLVTTSTLAGVAVEVMRRHFMSELPAPTTTTRVFVNRSRKDGYVKRAEDRIVFGADSSIRHLACRSYSSGRVEAFSRGLIIEPIAEHDVAALYPSAALLQPLPNEHTKWWSVHELRDVIPLEGFGHFKFSFPRSQNYPSLPVTREGVARITFPRSGETFCTFAEVRAALELGADVEIVDARGFEPGSNERDHDIGKYMREHVVQKNASTKGTLEYETAKLLMNSLVGKLGERVFPSRLLEIERYGRLNGVRGLGAIVKSFRGALANGPRVGKLWMPEHASLIVGKARALMTSITAMGAHLVSTDAVIGPSDIDYSQSAGVQELRSVGSDFKLEYEGDALFLPRSRLYAVLQRPDRIRLPIGGAVLARDEHWAVVRVARHGTTESKEQYAQTVLRCLAAGKDVAESQTKIRLLSAEASVRDGLDINDSVAINGTTYWNWDYKRVLEDRDVNVFTSWTSSKPYTSLAKLEAAEEERDVRQKKRRRRKVARVSPEAGDIVMDLLMGGESVRKIAARTGISKTTVARMKKHIQFVPPKSEDEASRVESLPASSLRELVSADASRDEN